MTSGDTSRTSTRPLVEWVQATRAPAWSDQPAPPQEPALPVAPRRFGRGAALGIAALAVVLVAGAAVWWLNRPKERSFAATPLVLNIDRGHDQVFRVHSVMDATAERVDLTTLEFRSEFDGVLVLKPQAEKGDAGRVKATLNVLRLVWNGRPITKPPAYRTNLRLRSDGNVLRGGVFPLDVPASTAQLASNGLSPDLPEGAVRPGDTWTDRFQVADPRLDVRVTTRSTFLRTERLQGAELAVVQGTRTLRLLPKGDGVRDRGTVTVDQTAWIDPIQGRVVKMVATAHWEMTGDFPEGRLRSDIAERIELTSM